jgi:hypothetical protein
MVESLKKYQKTTKLSDYVTIVKRNMGILEGNSNLKEIFMGKEYPGMDLLDEETMNLAVLSDLIGDG